MTTDLDLPAEIDARAPGLGPADFVFVFGTRLERPAEIAADLYHRGMAPFVVVTGGAARQPDGLNEAHHHRDLLVRSGVPEGAIVVEDRSTSTVDNVRAAVPLILVRTPRPMTAIAVVKRYHRRAIITLARHLPSLERIYTADYEAPLRPDRRASECERIRQLTAEGVDPLNAVGAGWRRTRTPIPRT